MNLKKFCGVGLMVLAISPLFIAAGVLLDSRALLIFIAIFAGSFLTAALFMLGLFLLLK